MIITKEKLKQIDMIARKMSKLGLGKFQDLRRELLEKYLSSAIKKITE